MSLVTDHAFWAGLWKVVVADVILAGDNAVVIALAVRSLPVSQQLWGRIFGAFGAVALRVAFVWIVSSLLKVPYLQLVGGILLIWIAWNLVRQHSSDEDEATVRAGASLWHAIWIIVLADLVMSFDNVMAISAASLDQNGHTRFELVIIGLLLSIPLVIFGSGLLSTLMKRIPLLVWLGAGLLGHVAGHMILEDDRVQSVLAGSGLKVETWLPPLLFALLTALGWWSSRPTAKERAARIQSHPAE